MAYSDPLLGNFQGQGQVIQPANKKGELRRINITIVRGDGGWTATMIPGKPSFLGGSKKKNMKEFTAGSLDLLVDQALFFAKKGFRQVPPGMEYHPNTFINPVNSRLQPQQAPPAPQQQYPAPPQQQYPPQQYPALTPQQTQYQYLPPQPQYQVPAPNYPTPQQYTQYPVQTNPPPQYVPQPPAPVAAPQIQAPAPVTQVQSTARTCKGCGLVVPENLKFCGGCGTKYEVPLPPPVPAQGFCGECGAKLTGTKHCTSCGARV